MITSLSQNPHINLHNSQSTTAQDVSFGRRNSYPYRPTNDVFDIGSDTGLDPLSIITPQGHILNCYYMAPKKGKPTVMFLHGGGKNASSYVRRMPGFLKDEGYGLLLAEYRGFGKSTYVNPNERTTSKDAHNIIEFLNKQKDTPDSDIILWGHSLGGAIAADLASNDKFKAVILDSTMTSLSDVVKNEFEGPIGRFINWLFKKNRHETIDKLPKIQSPVLILHAKEDGIVPSQMAVRNFEALTTDNKWLVINDDPDAEHGNMRWKEKPVAEFIHEL